MAKIDPARATESVEHAVERIFRPGDLGAVLRVIEFLETAATSATNKDIKGQWFTRNFGAGTLRAVAGTLRQHLVPALAKLSEERLSR